MRRSISDNERIPVTGNLKFMREGVGKGKKVKHVYLQQKQHFINDHDCYKEVANDLVPGSVKAAVTWLAAEKFVLLLLRLPIFD
jgi:hypothetical protein